MSSPVVGAARIEVLGDTSAMTAEMGASLEAAAARMAAQFAKVFSPAMETEMAAAGVSSGAAFARGTSAPLNASKAKMVAAGRTAGAGYTDGVVAGIGAGAPKVAAAGTAPLRDARGRYLASGRAAGAGYTDGVVTGMRAGGPAVTAAGGAQARGASKVAAEQGAVAGRGFMTRMREVMLGGHMITGAIFAGIGYEAVKMAGNFQTGMTRLVTAAGESKSQLAGVSAGVLDISRKTGEGTKELAAGMYMVESAGYHGKAALDVMQAAAEGAKVDMADANVVANALTTALTDMGKSAGTPADMMSKLVATVGHGKMTMDELASSIHSVLPNAAAIGLSFAQTAGAIATMTAQGISAQQATQNLNHAILSLANPTAVQTKAMAAFGLNASDVAKNLGKVGLTGTLDELQRAILGHMGPAGLTLTKALNSSQIAAGKVKTMLGALPPDVKHLADMMMSGGITAHEYSVGVGKLSAAHSVLGRQFLMSYNRAHGFSDILKSASPDAMTFSAAMAKMTGGQVGLQVALHLTGENMATYKANVKAISEAHTEAGGHVEGWAEKEKTFNQVMSQVKATIEAALITIGLHLLPVMTLMGNVLLHQVFPAIGFVVNALHSMYDLISGNDALKTFVLVIVGAIVVMKAYRMAILAYKSVAMAMYYTQILLNAALTANPIGLAVVAIAALAAGAVYAYEHFKPFRDIVDATGRVLRTVFITALHAVETAVRVTVDFIRDHWKLIAGIILVAMGPIVIAIALVSAAIYLLVRHFRDIERVAQETWASVTGWFTRLGTDITSTASRIWGAVTGWFHRMAADITNIATGIWASVIGWFHRTAADITGIANAIWGTVTGVWDKVYAATVGKLAETGRSIHDHWRLFLFTITAGVGLIYILIQDHWHRIASIFTRLYDDVAGVITALWHAVVGIWNRVYADVTGVASRLWRAVVGAWNRVYADVTGVASRLWRAVASFFTRIYLDVSGAVTRLWGAVSRFFIRIYTDVTGVLTRLWRAVVGIFNRVYADVAAVATRLWRGVTGIWNRTYADVTAVASRLWHAVAGFFTHIYNDITGVVSRMWAAVTGVWSRNATTVSNTASKLWHSVTGFFGHMKDDVIAAFNAAVTGVQTAWNKVREIVAAPIRWVVNTVYNHGILPVMHGLGGVLHESSMQNMQTIHFSEGGVVPGRKAQGDNVPIYATAGELVVPTHVVAGWGGPNTLMSALGFPGGGGDGGHYGIGGVIGGIGGKIKGGAKAVGGAVGSAAGAVGHAAMAVAGDLTHLVRGALAGTVSPIIHRLEALADRVLRPMGGIGPAMAGGVHYMGDSVIRFVTGDDSQHAGATVSGPNSGSSLDYARIIIQQAKGMGLGPKGAEIGLMTALVESGLRNYANANIAESLRLPHDAVGSDHYSAGLFQQQTGPFGNYWGTVAQVMNPAYSAHRFFDELVRKVPDWQNQDSGYDAQTVQVSAFPGAYSARRTEADALIKRLGFDSGGLAVGAGFMPKATIQPERVLSPRQTSAFERLVAVAERGGIGGPLVHVEHAGSNVDLDLFARQADFKARQGSFT